MILEFRKSCTLVVIHVNVKANTPGDERVKKQVFPNISQTTQEVRNLFIWDVKALVIFCSCALTNQVGASEERKQTGSSQLIN